MTARILAIDDSEQTLELIELFLEATEFELVTAQSGHAGLEAVRTGDFDLILLDILMPELDGFEVCRRLKADPRTREIPVIFMTGQDSTTEQRLAAFEIGAVDQVHKPLHGEELTARIRAMLRLRAASDRLESEILVLRERLQRSVTERDVMESDLRDLRGYMFGEGGQGGMLVVVDSAGAVLHANSAFDAYLARTLGAGLPSPLVLPELGALGRAESGRGEVELSLGGAAQRLDYERLDVPGASSHAVVLALTDTRRAQALRSSIVARRPVSTRRAEATDYVMTGTVGHSHGMRAVSKVVDRLRNVRSTVLIHGESGTGKELVARALHFDGKYKSKPFIPIHCGAISPHLIESELFGHEKGAFTGAAAASAGLLKAADGGTVFLDEISETTPDLQIKLLRVLQLGEVRPVGSSRSQTIDVRFIAATNRDLAERVRAGAFREDLFHRLNVVSVHLPGLRSRLDDVESLAVHFLRLHSERQGRELAPGVSRAALRRMLEYPWPGNVRELENAMVSALSLGCSDVIQEADLPEHIRTCSPPRLRAGDADPAAARRDREVVVPRPVRRRDEEELEAIRDALQRFDGDKQRAAEDLGIPRSTFYRKLKQL